MRVKVAAVVFFATVSLAGCGGSVAHTAAQVAKAQLGIVTVRTATVPDSEAVVQMGADSQAFNSTLDGLERGIVAHKAGAYPKLASQAPYLESLSDDFYRDWSTLHNQRIKRAMGPIVAGARRMAVDISSIALDVEHRDHATLRRDLKALGADQIHTYKLAQQAKANGF